LSDKFKDDGSTPICADWLNQVDQLVYNVFQAAETPEQAREAIDVPVEAPKDGSLYARRNGAWELVATAPELQILTMYLGAYPSAPGTGFNGQPLVVGMMYYDTSLDVGRVYTGTGWLSFTDTSQGVTVTNYSANRWLINFLESPDGTRTVFTMRDGSGTPLGVTTNEHVEIYVDGHIQKPGTDYSASGSTLTMVEAPLATSNMWGVWIDDDGDWQP
jgi:hypothetical protein